MQHVERLLPMIRNLAERALGSAIDATPHQPREGELVISLMEAVPAARILMGETGVALESGLLKGASQLILASQAEARRVKCVDGRGHHRLVYHYLMLSLHVQCSADVPHSVIPESDGQIHHTWLRQWCRFLPRMVPVDRDPWDEHGPLHTQTPDDTPDAWVYREMCALHGLFAVGAAESETGLLKRARRAARYHVEHTQPDYTTYQPWALSAFACWPETAVFAEQQLHDVTSHLSIERGPGALVPGLLLADAWATLDMLVREPDRLDGV